MFAMKLGIHRLLAFALLLLLALPVFAGGCGWNGGRGGAEEDPALEQVLGSQLADALDPVETPDPTPAQDPGPPDPGPPGEDEPPEPEEPAIEAWPVRMYIPALGVDAEIQDTDTDIEADTMEIVPSADIISWWRDSAIPGNRGNAIFGGHNRWRGEIGQLLRLDTLEIGDELEIIYEDGTNLKFRLESVFVYLLATAPGDVIMDVQGETRVTLITCKDPFNPATGTSDNRIIAIFKPEEGFEIPNPPIEPFPLKEE